MYNELKQVGFTDKEARVYLALIELGPSSVSEVARKAQINRTTGYDILEALVAKKLARSAEKRGKMIYVAENPDNIKKNLEEESQRYKIMAEKVNGIMPELKSLYTEIEKKPIVKFYEGIKGLKALYEDSLNSSEGLRAYTSTDDLKKIMGEYAEDYFQKRTDKKIVIRSIMPDSEYSRHLKSVGKEFLRDVRLVPPDKFNFSPEIYIYDDKLTLMSLRERFGVYIESKEIADALKTAFELAWERAGVYDSEIGKSEK